MRDPVHYYPGQARSGLCGRTSGNATCAATHATCWRCRGWILLAWLGWRVDPFQTAQKGG